MILYFLRHGDAANDANMPDSERPLTERGMQQAALVGTFLRRTGDPIDVILSSPLKRAVQTASIVQSGIAGPEPTATELLVNGNDLHELIEHLNSLGASSALLVGHAPHLSDTISLLLGGNTDSEIEMKKCSLAVVQTSDPVQPGSGLLKQLTHVATIAKLIHP